MGRRTADWLMAQAAAAGGRLEVGFDYATDYELIEYLIRDAGRWDEIRQLVLPVNVGALTGTIAGELAAEAVYRVQMRRGLSRHHALADAHAPAGAYRRAKAALVARASNPDHPTPEWPS